MAPAHLRRGSSGLLLAQHVDDLRLNATCGAARVPLVSAVIGRWEGQLSVFRPWMGGPCYVHLPHGDPGSMSASRVNSSTTQSIRIFRRSFDAELSAVEEFARDGRSVANWRDAEFFDSRFHYLLYEGTHNAMLRELGRFICRARAGRA